MFSTLYTDTGSLFELKVFHFSQYSWSVFLVQERFPFSTSCGLESQAGHYAPFAFMWFACRTKALMAESTLKLLVSICKYIHIDTPRLGTFFYKFGQTLIGDTTGQSCHVKLLSVRGHFKISCYGLSEERVDW